MQLFSQLATPLGPLWLALFAIYGVIIGSFLNVCIYRLPLGISVAKGRSFCPACHHTLTPKDLVPLASYALLKGKCAYCGAKISGRYCLIEALTGLLFAFIFLRFGLSPYSILVCGLTAVLVVITGIDFATQQIPDPLQWIILVLAVLTIFFPNQENNLALYHKAIGAACISLPMLAVAYFTNGFGGGDIKLMAVVGIFLGTYQVILAFFLATFFGAIYGIYLITAKKQSRKSAFAFGPFLSLGIFISCLYGQSIILLYLQLFV